MNTKASTRINKAPLLQIRKCAWCGCQLAPTVISTQALASDGCCDTCMEAAWDRLEQEDAKK